jgi:hypothetical protein
MVQLIAALYFVLTSLVIWGVFLWYTFGLQKAEVQREGYWTVRQIAAELSQDLQNILSLEQSSRRDSRPLAYSDAGFSPVAVQEPSGLGVNQFFCLNKVQEVGKPVSLVNASGQRFESKRIGLDSIPGRDLRLIFAGTPKDDSVLVYANSDRRICVVNLSMRIFLEIKQAVFTEHQSGAFAIAANTTNHFAKDAASAGNGFLFSTDPLILGPKDHQMAKSRGSTGAFVYFSLVKGKFWDSVEGFGEAPIKGTNAYVLLRWVTDFDVLRNAYALKYSIVALFLQALILFVYIFYESRRIYMPLFAIADYIKSLKKLAPNAEIPLLPVPQAFPWSIFNPVFNELLGVVKSLRRSNLASIERSRLVSESETVIQVLLFRKLGQLKFQLKDTFDPSDSLLLREYSGGEDIKLSESFQLPEGSSFFYCAKLGDGSRFFAVIPTDAQVSRLIATFLTFMLKCFSLSDLQRFVAEVSREIDASPGEAAKACGGIAICQLDGLDRIVMFAGAADWRSEEVDGQRFVIISKMSTGFRDAVQRFGRPTFEIMTDEIRIYSRKISPVA